MCGLAGIVSADPAILRSLPPMVDRIRHRGPDDEGIAYLDGAALGHRRLSIIDLEGGYQPMPNAAGTITLVFNGEIYNFPALRAQLEADGARFRTNSDTEVILHLYERFGDECVHHLSGMFAFALWDAPRRRLLAARDHMGQKPFFYCRSGGGLLFGSEVKSILASGLMRPEPDYEALYHYVSLRFIPDHLTLFSGVHKLPAGHRLVFENGDVRTERYWSIADWSDTAGSDEELIDALDARLNDTVQAHLLSDVPVGSFLSGGIDSSLITAIMSRHSDEPPATFSIGVREQQFNELPYAKMVADQYHTDHHARVVQANLIHLVPRMIWHLDEPADPFGVGVYLVSQLAAEHVKVVLSGDGGDELFAGYDRYAGNRLADLFGMVPRTLRSSVFPALIDRVPDTFGYKSLAQKLRWLNEMSLLDSGERYAHAMSFLRFTEEDKAQLFSDEVLGRLGASRSDEKIFVHYNADNLDDLVDRMLYTDLMTRIPDHLLPIVDRMAMAHGLEVRPPLLEHEFVEFAARLPSSLKLRGTKLKYGLRRVAERYMDKTLVTRKKQGFGFPLAHWMRHELSGILREISRNSRFVDAGIFDGDFIRELTEDHIGGKRDHNFRLWLLLNLELWYRLCIDGESLEDVGGFVESQVGSASTLASNMIPS